MEATVNSASCEEHSRSSSSVAEYLDRYWVRGEHVSSLVYHTLLRQSYRELPRDLQGDARGLPR